MFGQFSDFYNSLDPDPAKRGKQFEHFVKWFLKADPEWATQEARAERKKFHRWSIGHPAEPSTRFQELAEAIQRFPLEAAQGEIPLEALLNARRVAKEIQLVVGPEPELDVNPDFEGIFHEYTAILDQQILLLRVEVQRLMKGERA